MKLKLSFLAGAAVGYVLGARAGRDSYEAMKQQADALWHDPRVQEKVSQAGDVAKEKAAQAGTAVKEKAPDVGAKVSAAAGSAASSAKDAASSAKDKVAGSGSGTKDSLIGEESGSDYTPRETKVQSR